MPSPTTMTPQMTVMDVLKGGGQVQLPNGIVLKGSPSTGYIQIGFWAVDGNFTDEGLWSLDESGLQNALDDAQGIADHLAGNGEDEEVS